MKFTKHAGKESEIETGAKKPGATSYYGLAERYRMVDFVRPAPSRLLRDALNAHFWNFPPAGAEPENDSKKGR